MMKGKTCLVTGATNGIGLATATALAAQGATVVVHGRNKEKGLAVVEEIIHTTQNHDVSFVQADFASLADVRQLAAQLNEQLPRLDVLVNNAGLMSEKATVTKDGFETTFGVNHLAPFLLTNLMLEKIKASAPARIINVSSDTHRMGKLDFDDLMLEKKYGSHRAYANSKLANVLFTHTLGKRLQGTGVTVNALSPGAVRTGIGQDRTELASKILAALFVPFLQPAERGAQTSIFLASSADVEGQSGGYYAKNKLAKTSHTAQNDAVAEQLWQVSDQLTAQ